jgi:PAS domain S-box-containing protein
MQDEDRRVGRPVGAPADPSVPAAGLRDALRRKVADLVLEHAAEGIWLIDADARTTFVNRRAADLLGYTEEEMIGEHVFAFIDRERWPTADRNLKRREFGIEERLEVELRRKDGTRVWTIGSATPIFDRDGAYAGTLAVFGDLTAQKQRERRLRARIDDLTAGAASLEEEAPYREPFRTAIVIATCSTFVATVALVAAGAVAVRLFGFELSGGTIDP